MNERLRRVMCHLVPRDGALPVQSSATSAGEDAQLQELFGSHCYSEGPLFPTGGGGRKYYGIDLVPQLSTDQVEFLLDALALHRIVCIAGQDLERFSMSHFERFANHWGAVLPHPNNFTRGGIGAQGQGATDGEIEWLPFEQRTVSRADQTFPGQLKCLPHESPAVLVTSNFGGPPREENEPAVGSGGSWHTDIEYEVEPIYVSMFLVHKAPVSRKAAGGTWVAAPEENGGSYFDGSDEELMRLRKHLPLNGETAYADTAAAFAALDVAEQSALEQVCIASTVDQKLDHATACFHLRVMVRRRLNDGDEGWLAPLVRTDPRSGLKSLHSPIWASRPRVRPAIEVEGMSTDESRLFLDRLEAHCLRPEFRYADPPRWLMHQGGYDHAHTPGDVTLWHNYMTLHNSPPCMNNINHIDDARLMYRLSCKGEPALQLPRQDDPDWLEENIVGRYTSDESIFQL